ncbi:hypothetical protein [Corynebacterium tapiri]|uniref:Uncharacterized protein n=1 Tax=Corynebacterium tapiri TaxID=1448266 RepID=A0A5C4U354_9CORY|nr:hypothetical protein [Corynebacterium tapiri]TNL96833.1 hypothetical protein FHE74_07375 [Corynebacterium tapiri]
MSESHAVKQEESKDKDLWGPTLAAAAAILVFPLLAAFLLAGSGIAVLVAYGVIAVALGIVDALRYRPSTSHAFWFGGAVFLAYLLYFNDGAWIYAIGFPALYLAVAHGIKKVRS